MQITEEYRVFYKDKEIGVCYVYEDGSVYFSAFSEGEEFEEELRKLKLNRDRKFPNREALSTLFGKMREENRLPGTRKKIWQDGALKIEWVPKDVERFVIYRRSAEKGEPGYSEKDHSAPHYEGPNTPEGMREWASWYCFNKKEDGMYEAELDEAWWWGGGHNDGGTIRREVPEEWLTLPYDEFLEEVVWLAAAHHYGFTAEDLKEKEGLREFFGFPKE